MDGLARLPAHLLPNKHAAAILADNTEIYALQLQDERWADFDQSSIAEIRKAFQAKSSRGYRKREFLIVLRCMCHLGVNRNYCRLEVCCHTATTSSKYYSDKIQEVGAVGTYLPYAVVPEATAVSPHNKTCGWSWSLSHIIAKSINGRFHLPKLLPASTQGK